MTHQPESTATLRIPVIEEIVHVEKHATDTGRGVRLHKAVSEEVWHIEDTLQQQVLDMTRVPVNVWVAADALPVQRQDGPTLIIPVLEEVLVLEKRIRLKEEIRITVNTETHQTSERIVLRKEQVSAERFDEPAASPSASFEGEQND